MIKSVVITDIDETHIFLVSLKRRQKNYQCSAGITKSCHRVMDKTFLDPKQGTEKTPLHVFSKSMVMSFLFSRVFENVKP